MKKSLSTTEVDDLVDIDLEDPKVKDATLKLQAGFSRLMAMKKLSNKSKSTKKELSSTPKVDD